MILIKQSFKTLLEFVVNFPCKSRRKKRINELLENKMTESRGWKALFSAIGICILVLTLTRIINTEASLKEYNVRPMELEKFNYSWAGPNALARSALIERQEKLQFNCEDMVDDVNSKELLTSPENWKNIIVDEKHKLLYCYVPKVACTNWKRVLMIATGKWAGNEPLEIPADLAHSKSTFLRLSNFTSDEIASKLSSYDKLIVVRHPLERLLSAYRNKLEAKNEKSSRYFQTRFGKRIIERYRINATAESIQNGNDVTFSEFVDFITDKTENGTQNEHWRPIYDLCHPCLVNYNFVSKYESLVEDATEILERIGAGPINFPGRPTSSEPTLKKLDRYYSTLSYKQLRKLTDLYRLDLRLFDYSLEDVVGFSLA